MRFLESLICVGLIGAVGAVASVEGQTRTVNGPTLGFTPNVSGSIISPVIGIPGASLMTDHLALDTAIRAAIVSPKQDYALALRSDDAQPVAIDLTGAAPQTIVIGGARPAPALIALSPAGSAAATFDAESKTIQVITGLPQAPQIVHEFSLGADAGRATSLHISDDGSVALIKIMGVDGTGLWALSASGSFSRLPIDQPSAAAFFANRNDAIVSDSASQSAFIIMDAGGAATQVPLTSAIDGMQTFSSITASDDGSRVFLADANSGNIAIVDVQTRRAAVVDCGCQPSGFYRMNGRSIFRLMDASANPISMLDASGSQPRIVLVAPNSFLVSEAAQ
jgi:DNA-binding beta-propeller fold protein YncE